MRSHQRDEHGDAASVESELVFRRASGGRLAIGPDAQSTLLAHRQLSSRAAEAGGILLGRLLLGSDDVVVDQAAEPVAEDRRARFHFIRALLPAQTRVVELWRQSRGTTIYLGEWHTHPEDLPTPSWLDEREWRRIATMARYEQSHLFFVIVGRATARAFEVDRGGRVSPLEQLPR